MTAPNLLAKNRKLRIRQMEVELKPCPTCRKLPKLRRVKHEYKYFCGLHCSCGDWKHSVNDAANDWNRRSTGDGQPEYYKPTNFDVITESPEKLAKVATPLCVSCPVENCNLHNHGSWFCKDKFTNWLNSPTKEE